LDAFVSFQKVMHEYRLLPETVHPAILPDRIHPASGIQPTIEQATLSGFSNPESVRHGME